VQPHSIAVANGGPAPSYSQRPNKISKFKDASLELGTLDSQMRLVSTTKHRKGLSRLGILKGWIPGEPTEGWFISVNRC